MTAKSIAISSDENDHLLSSSPAKPAPKPRPKPRKRRDSPTTTSATPKRTRSKACSLNPNIDDFFARTSSANESTITFDEVSGVDYVVPAPIQIPRNNRNRLPSSSPGPKVDANGHEAGNDDEKVSPSRSSSATPPLDSEKAEKLALLIKDFNSKRPDPFQKLPSLHFEKEEELPTTLDPELDALTAQRFNRSRIRDKDSNQDKCIVLVIDSQMLDSRTNMKAKPIQMVMRMNTSFEEIHRIMAQNLNTTVENVVLVKKDQKRIFPTSSPLSLKFEPGDTVYIDATTRRGFDIMREKRVKDTLKRIESLTEKPDPQPVAESIGVKLTLRSKHGDVKVKATLDETIADVAAKYRVALNLSKDSYIDLMLDGDILSPNDSIGDLDLENGDLIEVRSK